MTQRGRRIEPHRGQVQGADAGQVLRGLHRAGLRLLRRQRLVRPVLAPLLSPVLPLHIEDNEVTKNMADDAKMATRIDLMVKVLKAKLGGAMNVLALE